MNGPTARSSSTTNRHRNSTLVSVPGPSRFAKWYSRPSSVNSPRIGLQGSTSAVTCVLFIAVPFGVQSSHAAGLGGIKDIRDVEPELSLVVDLSCLSFCHMPYQVETVSLSTIVVFPLLFQTIPVEIAPTRNGEVEAVIFFIAVRHQLLRFQFQTSSGKTTILRTADDQLLIDYLLYNMIFESNEIGSRRLRKMIAEENDGFPLRVAPTT